MSLLSSLGLNDVPSDPNDIPDGKYDGIVQASEYVLVSSKNTLAHVVTYQVADGEYKGAQKQVWNTLYKNVVDANNNFPDKIEDVKGGESSMTDANKRWYKKMWCDLLNLTDAEYGQREANLKPEDLVGIPVTFGIKTKDGYKNVNFVERRMPETTAAAASGISAF
jgi:hypothetical protein